MYSLSDSWDSDVDYQVILLSQRWQLSDRGIETDIIVTH